MAKKQTFDMNAYLQNNLQNKLKQFFGTRTIENTELPDYFGASLNPLMPLRPYQKEAFQYFINYWEGGFDSKPYRPHMLFHMATGSGKTLIMAGLILYLYRQGYRNFLFFVPSTNVVGKTEDNLFNVASVKYQFAQSINIDGKQVEIHRVDNFQGVGDDCINLCLTTIQGLHIDLNTPREGGVSYGDFSSKGLVLISDEAHHMNGAVKKGNDAQLTLWDDDEFAPSSDWESTVMRIFKHDTEDGMPNVLLEFTATEDFTEPSIAEKYKDKVIFDYPLRRFREDGYSKDIALVQSDASPLERAIQAIILSQYRRKLFTAIRQNIKPVVMFKSKTIKENSAFHNEFVATLKNLTVSDLQRIKANAKNDVLDAFTYFDERNITLDNLLLELQDDFKEDNLLLVDGNNIDAKKQAHLNSLEDKDNEYRAVFAVDMLNEGWDVLNLFDIVRLYDTRDARAGQVGKTTNAEAQLIGRGARYMPFNVRDDANDVGQGYETGAKNDLSLPVFARKFDNDIANRLRVLETLHYHASHNPRYVQEISTALTNTGIIAPKSKTVTERLKPKFKMSRLYTEGYVFTNDKEPYLLNQSITDIGKSILEETYSVRIKSGDMVQSTAFEKATAKDIASLITKKFELGDFGKHILRGAINRLPEFTFESLSEVYPNLVSIQEFIESDGYLNNIRVNVLGRKDVVTHLSQRDMLNVTVEVLKQIAPKIPSSGMAYRGTKVFKPLQVRDIFHDHTYHVQEGSQDKESGKSIKSTENAFLHLDIDAADWFAYDDNFGTAEEKALIKYIESHIDDLKEKYEEVYLLRNHKDLQIYAFKDGRATEPDFILFMRRRQDENTYDNIQIFIEPKGEHLRDNDAWKEDFEKDIHSQAIIRFATPNQEFEVWGMPFYTENHSKEFEKTMRDNFMT